MQIRRLSDDHSFFNRNFSSYFCWSLSSNNIVLTVSLAHQRIDIHRFLIPIAQTTTSKTGWNWDKNYEVNKTEKYSAEKSDEYDDRKRKPSYRNSEDDDDSYKRKPSYKDSGDEYDNEYSSNENEGYKDKYDDDYKPSKSRSSKRVRIEFWSLIAVRSFSLRFIRRNTRTILDTWTSTFAIPTKMARRADPSDTAFQWLVTNAVDFVRINADGVFPEHRAFLRLASFGPLVSFLPWIPIFADRVTKQTIIYSPTGGGECFLSSKRHARTMFMTWLVYILPPLINFYGRLISVAELIASGYASLVGTGVPPPPALDIAPLVQPTPGRASVRSMTFVIRFLQWSVPVCQESIAIPVASAVVLLLNTNRFLLPNIPKSSMVIDPAPLQFQAWSPISNINTNLPACHSVLFVLPFNE